MPVYVDKARNHFRGMILCHMLADTLDELHAMADMIGLQRAWFQAAKTPHYDINPEHRERALKAGAIEIDRRTAAQLVRFWRAKKNEA